MATFSERLKARRLALGMTQEQLGRAVGMSDSWSQISYYEHAVREPRLGMLCALAAVLACSVDYLIGLSEIAEPAAGAAAPKRPEAQPET